MKPLHGIMGRLRQRINKLGGATHANRVLSQQQQNEASGEGVDEVAPAEDCGEFGCKSHQETYKDMCRKARQAAEEGDQKSSDFWRGEAEDFDRRKGMGRH